jgi:hypothetical protein
MQEVTYYQVKNGKDLDSKYFDGTWDIAKFIIGNFARIKEIVEAYD